MRTIAIALILVAAVTSAEARTKKTVIVQYETDHGWSEGLCRTVDFFAASEPAIAIAGMIIQKRPTNIAMAPVTL